jgi:hypothetical protein
MLKKISIFCFAIFCQPQATHITPRSPIMQPLKEDDTTIDENPFILDTYKYTNPTNLSDSHTTKTQKTKKIKKIRHIIKFMNKRRFLERRKMHTKQTINNIAQTMHRKKITFVNELTSTIGMLNKINI